jgi:hypothetical protein
MDNQTVDYEYNTAVAHISYVKRCQEMTERYVSMRCPVCGPFQIDEMPLRMWWNCESVRDQAVAPVHPVYPMLAGMLLSVTTPEHPLIQRCSPLIDYLKWLDEVFGEHEITTSSSGWIYYSVESPNLACLSKIAVSNPDYRDFWHGHSLVVPVNNFELGAVIWQRNNP